MSVKPYAPASGVRPTFTISKILSETVWPIKAKPLKSSPEPEGLYFETWYEASGNRALQSSTNHDTGMTLTFFTIRSTYVAHAFEWEK